MAGRGTKPISIAQGHRTKAEKQLRATAEKELMTGQMLTESEEVKNNPVAHKEFLRLKKLFRAIGKDDDLCGDTINIFCTLVAECAEFEQMKRDLTSELELLTEEYRQEKIDFMVFVAQKNIIIGNIFTCDKKLMDKRKMRNDISKENIMTVQSALRSIPKKVESESEDPLLKALRGE